MCLISFFISKIIGCVYFNVKIVYPGNLVSRYNLSIYYQCNNIIHSICNNFDSFIHFTLRLDFIPSFCAAVASPIARWPHSSRPIVAYVADIMAIGKKYVSIINATLYLKSKEILSLFLTNPLTQS